MWRLLGLALVWPSLSAAADVDLGERVYLRNCAMCHGVKGDGKGPAARALQPAPRDFTTGEYKFRSTDSGSVPTDDDLRRTIDLGVPGTEMPAWGPLLTSEERDAVIDHIKAFCEWFEEELYEDEIILDPANLPPRPAPDVEAGRAVYVKAECAKCHGDDGRGGVNEDLEDSSGDAIKAFDFTRGTFRGGQSGADVFRSLTTGIGGTPMPSFLVALSHDERWHLVDYIESLRRPAGPLQYLFRAPTWNHLAAERLAAKEVK